MGASLTCVSLHALESGTDCGLTALLRRQTRLKTIDAPASALPGLTQAIAQGYCRGLECIALNKHGFEKVDEKWGRLGMAVLRQAREQTTPIYIEVMNAFEALMSWCPQSPRHS